MISRTLERGERLRGAGIGALGMMLTLFMGGALSFAIQWILGMVPYGSLVWSKFLFWVPSFASGVWLAVPAAAVGAWKGEVTAFEWSIIPWGTSDTFGRRATVLSWVALILACLATEWIIRAL